MFRYRQSDDSSKRRKPGSSNNVVAQGANEDVGEQQGLLVAFTKTINHHMRNPMTGTAGNAHFLLEEIAAAKKYLASTSLPDEAHATFRLILANMETYCKAILKCHQHQTIILDDVVNLSLLDAHQFVLQVHPFKARKAFKDAVNMFKWQTDKQNLKLNVNLPSDELLTRGDERRCVEIIDNLVTNAIQFTANGEITVSLEYDTTGNDGHNRLKISVSDTGVGMSPDEVEHLFRRFREGGVKTSAKYDGTGLGLYRTWHLVRLMGGEINVTSEAGKGSCFSVIIKTEQLSPEEIINFTQHNEQHDTVMDTKAAEKHVLIVDDNKMNQKILERLMKQRGYQCQLADNGQEAVDKWAKGRFDIILMDVAMPVMDGLEATRAIRSAEQKTGARAVPVIGISGNASEQDIQAGKEAGMNDYLVKPYKNDVLYSSIEKFTRDSPPIPKAASFENSFLLFAISDSTMLLLNKLKEVAGELINQQYPFEATAADQKIVFRLTPVPPYFTAHTCQLILQEFKKILEKFEKAVAQNCDNIYMENIQIVDNKLIVTPYDPAQLEQMKQIFCDAGFDYAFKREIGRSMSPTVMG